MKISMLLYGVKVRFSVPDVPLTRSRLKSAIERMKTGQVKEYWVQDYVKKNGKKLGFSNLVQHEIGADFTGVYQGKRVKIEVEVLSGNFIKHGHGRGWANILVVLSPVGQRIKGIKTIYLNLEDFVRWWWPRSGGYKAMKDIERRLDWVANVFASEFREACGDKDREMSTCSECDLCPYFGGTVEGDELCQFIDSPHDHPGFATEYFRAMATHYLKKRRLLEKVLSGKISTTKIFKRICPSCGKKFEPHFPNQIYCSKYCLKRSA